MRRVERANIYRVIQIQLNKLVYDNVRMIINLPSERI